MIDEPTVDRGGGFKSFGAPGNKRRCVDRGRGRLGPSCLEGLMPEKVRSRMVLCVRLRNPFERLASHLKLTSLSETPIAVTNPEPVSSSAIN